MARVSELAVLGTMAFGRLPLVVSRCDYKEAAWFGQYYLNIDDSDELKRGPYPTEEAACAAVEATGRWKRRPKSNDPRVRCPHYDAI